MDTALASSAPSLSVRNGTSLNIGVRPDPSGSAAAQAESSALGAKQGADLVNKGLANATKAYAVLSQLQSDIQDAAKSGQTLSTDQTKALNDRISEAKARLDQLAGDAAVGDSNLLSAKTSSVTVSSETGVKVRVATQGLDAKSLGLGDIAITDAASLRNATARIAQATGNTQLAVFRLQTAEGATGPATAPNPASAVFDKLEAARNAAPAAGSASDFLEKAITNQLNANRPSGYGTSGGQQTLSILDLLT